MCWCWCLACCCFPLLGRLMPPPSVCRRHERDELQNKKVTPREACYWITRMLDIKPTQHTRIPNDKRKQHQFYVAKEQTQTALILCRKGTNANSTNSMSRRNKRKQHQFYVAKEQTQTARIVCREGTNANSINSMSQRNKDEHRTPRIASKSCRTSAETFLISTFSVVRQEFMVEAT
jgi:hypothetical protein